MVLVYSPAANTNRWKELALNIINAVIELKEKHRETWRDMPESYWLARLMQEVGELGSSLVGDHDDPAEWELMQISAICLNWLEMRNPQVLPTKRAPDLLPRPACCASFVFDGTHHRDCRFAKSASG